MNRRINILLWGLFHPWRWVMSVREARAFRREIDQIGEKLGMPKGWRKG
jgi:hypothetical protein